MAIVDEIERIKTNIENAYTALEEKGATLPTERNSANLSAVIIEVPTGGGSGDEELINSYMSLVDNTLGANCTKLPDGITSLGDYAFYGRTNLAITELPKTLTYIGKQAFCNCTYLNITEVWGTQKKTTSSYVEIQSSCFFGCNHLNTIKIININNPKNLPLQLDDYCFKSCTRLEIVDLPSNTKAMSDYVFQSCTSLKTLICRATTPPTIYSTAFSGVTFDVIYVPDNSLDTYKSASNWSKFASKMKPLSEYGG